jgi:hypothetical protein
VIDIADADATPPSAAPAPPIEHLLTDVTEYDAVDITAENIERFCSVLVTARIERRPHMNHTISLCSDVPSQCPSTGCTRYFANSNAIVASAAVGISASNVGKIHLVAKPYFELASSICSSLKT